MKNFFKMLLAFSLFNLNYSCSDDDFLIEEESIINSSSRIGDIYSNTYENEKDALIALEELKSSYGYGNSIKGIIKNETPCPLRLRGSYDYDYSVNSVKPALLLYPNQYTIYFSHHFNGSPYGTYTGVHYTSESDDVTSFFIGSTSPYLTGSNKTISAFLPLSNITDIDKGDYNYNSEEGIYKIETTIESISSPIVKSVIKNVGEIVYRATEIEIKKIAEDLNISISDNDVKKLKESLVFYDNDFISSCNENWNDETKHNIVKRASGNWTVGAVIGGSIGAVVGAGLSPFTSGTSLAISTSIGASLGANIGAGIGNHLPVETNNIDYTPKEKELSTLVDCPQEYFLLENNSYWEDLFEWDFPRYGEIELAGSISKSKGDNKLSVFYPKSNIIDLPNKTKYDPFNNIYKYIFVIVEINGKYQMRIHPEDFYPDSLSASERVNHSQMSMGGRYARLLGYSSMQVYGAGTIYVENNELIGIDSRTGHYYYSLYGKDNEMLDTAENLLKCLGYIQNKKLMRGKELTGYINSAQNLYMR